MGDFHSRFERKDSEGESCDDEYMNFEVAASLILAGFAALGVFIETARASTYLRAAEAGAAALAIPLLLYAQIKLFKDVIYAGDTFLWFRSSTVGQIIVIRILIIQMLAVGMTYIGKKLVER